MPHEETPRDPHEPHVRRPLQGDEAALFESFDRHLRRMVRRKVNTSPDIVDDACAFAWSQFLRYQPDRARAWRSWLVTTAEREALRLHGVEAAHRPPDWLDGEPEFEQQVDIRDRYAEREALRRALDLLAEVPERRRNAKVLQVMGFTYAEIADVLGLSKTRVNHFLIDATEIIREAHERTAPEHEPRSPRAARLYELERVPPEWLTRAIGRPPHIGSEVTLAWRRAALALDDYRREFMPEFDGRELGARPTDAGAAHAYERAHESQERVLLARTRARRRRRGVNRDGPPPLEL